MKSIRFAAIALGLLAAAAGIAAGAAAPKAPVAAPKPAGTAAPRSDWSQTVTVTAEGSHLIGNPEAKTRLVEYVSYTCSHCAHFEVEASAALTLGFIGTGRGSVEYRSFLRNKIDVAASLVVSCGPPSKFRANHALFLRTQDKWLSEPNPAQLARWNNDDFAAAMRAIARDLKFYEMMEPRGYTRQQLDTCLADRPAADRIAMQNRRATQIEGVEGTPSFLLDGTLRAEHDWAGLRPVLMAATR